MAGKRVTPTWIRYGFALLMVMLAVAVRMSMLQPLGARMAFITFYPAVVLAALYGGMGPGFLAAVLSALIGVWYWVEPARDLMISDPVNRLSVIAFLLSSLVIAYAAQIMHRARARADSVVDSSDDAIITKTLEGTVTSWNAGAERTFGYTAEEMIGSHISRLVPDDHVKEDAEILRRLRAGEPVEHYETRRRRKDGEIIDVSLTVSPLRSRGVIIGASKIARDITARKRNERAHRKSEEQLRVITDATPALISYIDRDYRYQFVNLQYEHWFGIPRGEIPGMSVSEVLGREAFEQLRPSMDRALGGEKVHFEREVSYRSSGIRMIEGFYMPDVDEEGRVRGIYVLVIDITARHKAERELAAALEAAQSANRAKDRFLATLSHELRTPLTPALLLAESMCEDGSLPPRAREAFQTIRSNIELEARLIDDLLDLSRVREGKVRLDLQPCDVHALVNKAGAFLQPEISAQGHVFTFDLSASGTVVRADPVRLQQVFWNVLRNAVKFTPAGGAISVRSRNDDGAVVVSVTDSGIGITPEELPGIFDAFSQAEHALGGLGLGLAISSQLLREQGGRIWAESPGRGQGATFHIELPLAAGREETTFTDLVPVRTAGLPCAGLRILLLEDHLDTRTALSRLLTRRGHVVTAVSSIAQARNEAGSGQFDLLVSDLGLPDGDGHSLMRELNQKHGLRGIALSGFGMEADIQTSLAAGFIAHLTKPVTFEAIEQAMARFAATASQQAEGGGF